MPVFEQAQTEFPDVAFVLVNQGESAQQAQDYLDSEGLNLTDVLLDPASEAMRTMRSRGLPTTLFFDAQRRQVDMHLGEITMHRLKDKMSRRFALPSEYSTELPEEHTSEHQSLMRITYAAICSTQKQQHKN